MKVGVVGGRVVLVVGDRVVDVAEASGGAISSDPAGMFAAWQDLLALDTSGGAALDESRLELPIPVPRQAFGIGLNYGDHAAESAMTLPEFPMVFPKFATSIVGPDHVVQIGSDAVDWEAELVVVIGTDCRGVAAEDAWSVVAGLSVGQDLSERAVQFEGGANPQFGLGKSAPGFGPIGPWVVSVDEFADGVDLDIRCELNGVEKQSSNTHHLIFDIPTLVAYLSSRVQLLAGDVIFTGTPAGVGWGRDPKEFLADGDVLTTTIERIGSITTKVARR